MTEVWFFFFFFMMSRHFYEFATKFNHLNIHNQRSAWHPYFEVTPFIPKIYIGIQLLIKNHGVQKEIYRKRWLPRQIIIPINHTKNFLNIINKLINKEHYLNKQGTIWSIQMESHFSGFPKLLPVLLQLC